MLSSYGQRSHLARLVNWKRLVSAYRMNGVARGRTLDHLEDSEGDERDGEKKLKP
jgi:hypothetical protein